MTTKKLSELPLAGTYNGSEYLLGMQNGLSTKFLLGKMGDVTISGNVGIGTASPSAKVDIANRSTGVDNQLILARGNNDGSFLTIVKTGPATAGVQVVSSIGVDYATTYTDLAAIKFWRNGGAGGEIAFNTGATANGTERMRINSSGNVTMPYQLCCVGSLETFVSLATPLGLVIDYNMGTMGNTTTDRITVPIAGRYFVHMRQLVNGAAGVYFCINVNGVAYRYPYGNMTGFFTDIQATAIIPLNANDYITFSYTTVAPTATWSVPHSEFSVYLLG